MLTPVLKLLPTRIYLTVVVISVTELACPDLLPHYYPCFITKTETMVTNLSLGTYCVKISQYFSPPYMGNTEEIV
jgi:hypothetical protein